MLGMVWSPLGGWVRLPAQKLTDHLCCDRPGRLTKMVDDFMTTAIKRAVMNPAYMRAAWEQEAENIEIFGATVEDMLVRSLPCTCAFVSSGS